MNAERFRQVLDSYGADEARWPAECRAEMLSFIDVNADARQWLQSARAVDELLDSYDPGAVDLTDRILTTLPRSWVERFVAWLLPATPALWWRPAMAGAMPLVLGVAIGLGQMTEIPQDSLNWELQEQALLSTSTGDWYE